MNDAVLLTVWLARNNIGDLFMFPAEPIRHPLKSGMDLLIHPDFLGMRIPNPKSGKELFPAITYSNSPVKADISFSDIAALPIGTLQIEEALEELN